MIYGVNLLLAALAFPYSSTVSCVWRDRTVALRQALGRDLKGKVSPLIYLFGIIGSLLWVWLGIAAYVLVAVIWLIPDRRIEHYIDAHQGAPGLAAVISRCRQAKDPGDTCRSFLHRPLQPHKERREPILKCRCATEDHTGDDRPMHRSQSALI